ncbi:hypothetical protein GCM10018962_24550 [Dactylosporangium matsuzakiense]
MPTRLLLEGRDLEELLAQVRDEHGPDAVIISAEKVRSGGVGGLFGTQKYELTVEIPDPGEAVSAPAESTPSSAPATGQDDTPKRQISIEDLAAMADAAERRGENPTAASAFAELLAEEQKTAATVLPQRPATAADALNKLLSGASDQTAPSDRTESAAPSVRPIRAGADQPVAKLGRPTPPPPAAAQATAQMSAAPARATTPPAPPAAQATAQKSAAVRSAAPAAAAPTPPAAPAPPASPAARASAPPAKQATKPAPPRAGAGGPGAAGAEKPPAKTPPVAHGADPRASAPAKAPEPKPAPPPIVKPVTAPPAGWTPANPPTIRPASPPPAPTAPAPVPTAPVATAPAAFPPPAPAAPAAFPPPAADHPPSVTGFPPSAVGALPPPVVDPVTASAMEAGWPPGRVPGIDVDWSRLEQDWLRDEPDVRSAQRRALRDFTASPAAPAWARPSTGSGPPPPLGVPMATGDALRSASGRRAGGRFAPPPEFARQQGYPASQRYPARGYPGPAGLGAPGFAAPPGPGGSRFPAPPEFGAPEYSPLGLGAPERTAPYGFTAPPGPAAPSRPGRARGAAASSRPALRDPGPPPPPPTRAASLGLLGGAFPRGPVPPPPAWTGSTTAHLERPTGPPGPDGSPYDYGDAEADGPNRSEPAQIRPTDSRQESLMPVEATATVEKPRTPPASERLGGAYAQQTSAAAEAAAAMAEKGERADRSANGSSGGATVLARKLQSLGVPTDIAVGASTGDTYGAIVEAFTALPVADPAPDAPGETLIVVGESTHAMEVARFVAEAQRLDAEHILFAGRNAAAAGIDGKRRITGAHDARLWAKKLRKSDAPSVVAVEAALDEATWAAAIVEAVRPVAVWVVVDASRKTSDVAHHLQGLRRVDAICLRGTGSSGDPASPLSLRVPVALLDGRPSTPFQWAAMLCERLSLVGE